MSWNISHWSIVGGTWCVVPPCIFWILHIPCKFIWLALTTTVSWKSTFAGFCSLWGVSRWSTMLFYWKVLWYCGISRECISVAWHSWISFLSSLPWTTSSASFDWQHNAYTGMHYYIMEPVSVTCLILFEVQAAGSVCSHQQLTVCRLLHAVQYSFDTKWSYFCPRVFKVGFKVWPNGGYPLPHHPLVVGSKVSLLFVTGVRGRRLSLVWPSSASIGEAILTLECQCNMPSSGAIKITIISVCQIFFLSSSCHYGKSIHIWRDGGWRGSSAESHQCHHHPKSHRMTDSAMQSDVWPFLGPPRIVWSRLCREEAFVSNVPYSDWLVLMLVSIEMHWREHIRWLLWVFGHLRSLLSHF